MKQASSKGAAVLVAMLLAAFAAAVAASVFADQERWLASVIHRRDHAQAQALASAGVQWARQILEEDGRTTTTDHLREPWAIPLPPVPLDRAEIRGNIVDAQANLNINGLSGFGTDIGRARIRRLFEQRGGPLAALPAITDWLDLDDAASAQGAEDAFYRGLERSRLSANAPAVRALELVQVHNVTPAALRAVLPFLVALPESAAINVNTASAEALLAVFDRASTGAIAALLDSRAQKPFISLADFRGRLPAGVVLSSEDGLDVKSRYFLVTIEARQDDAVVRERALLHRERGRATQIVWSVAE